MRSSTALSTLEQVVAPLKPVNRTRLTFKYNRNNFSRFPIGVPLFRCLSAGGPHLFLAGYQKKVPKVIQTLLAPSVSVPRKGSGLTGPCRTRGIFSDCFDTFYGFVDQDLRLKCHPFPFPRSVTNAIVSLPGPCWHEATKLFHHLFSVPQEFFFSHTRHFSKSPRPSYPWAKKLQTRIPPTCIATRSPPRPQWTPASFCDK